jgi:hypothetical protein
MRIVISQSMLFPWIGLLEQVRLADVFVHYDDVQYSKGSFVNRVQVKLPEGVRWMSVPLQGHRLGQRIDAVQLAPSAQWRASHLDLLERSFKDAPHTQDALQLAGAVYGADYPHVGALARASLLALCRYFGLDVGRRFVDVTDLEVPGSGSARVLAVVERLGGDAYITGHGAASYLDHEEFERKGLRVEYMQYQCRPYPQAHGAFTPYVSALDLVARCGREGANHICSGTVPWKEFLNGSE